MSKITKTKFPLNKGWWKEWIQDAENKTGNQMIDEIKN